MSHLLVTNTTEIAAKVQSNPKTQTQADAGLIITRSVLEMVDEDMVYVAAPCKPFRSSHNSIVTHLTIVATKENLIIFDGDSNRIAELKLDAPYAPVQILKSSSPVDAVFFVRYQTYITQFRILVEELKESKGARKLSIAQDWSRQLNDLNITGQIKQSFVSRINKRIKLGLVDDTNSVVFVGKDIKTDEKMQLAQQNIQKLHFLNQQHLVWQESHNIVIKAKQESQLNCHIATKIDDFTMHQSNPNTIYVLSDDAIVVLQYDQKCKVLAKVKLSQKATNLLIVGSLLVALTENTDYIQILKLASDPAQIFASLGSRYKINCEYQNGYATLDHLVLQCQNQFVTLQSTIKPEVQESSLMDLVLAQTPAMIISFSILIVVWWQWSSFNAKRQKDIELNARLSDEKVQRQQKKQDNAYKDRNGPFDDSPKKSAVQKNRDVSDDAGSLVKSDLMSGLSAQARELAELKREMEEMKGSFGKDYSEMLSSFKNMTSKSEAFSKIQNGKQQSQLASDSD